MEDRGTGVILRVRPFSDTSLIVHWLTDDHGRIATMAKGARRPKSPLRGRLDLFFDCELSFQRSRRSELHALREVRVVDPHVRVREEVGWVQQAAYAAALVEQVTETETPLSEVLGLYRALLRHLPAAAPQARTVFAFELKLLRELGLEPTAAEGGKMAPMPWVRRLTEMEWEALGGLQVTASEVRALHRFLEGFLLQQFGKLARGRAEAIQAGIRERPREAV